MKKTILAVCMVGMSMSLSATGFSRVTQQDLAQYLETVGQSKDEQAALDACAMLAQMLIKRVAQLRQAGVKPSKKLVAGLKKLVGSLSVHGRSVITPVVETAGDDKPEELSFYKEHELAILVSGLSAVAIVGIIGGVWVLDHMDSKDSAKYTKMGNA